MGTDEYVPNDEDFIGSWACAHVTPQDMTAEEAKDVARAFLARVRRDAVQQFIEACRGKLDEPGFLLPSNYWEDIEAAIRVAESYVKNYPEETP